MRIAFLVFIVTFIFVLTARRLRPTVTTCEHGIVPTGWCEDCEMGILRTWPERGAEGIGKREIKMTNPMSDARLEEIEMRGKLAKELYAALSFLGADHQLLGAVSSWGDGEDETTILGYLQSWNRATRRQLAASLPATSPETPIAYLIWSNEHNGAWWTRGKDGEGAGYTSDPRDAGRWTLAEAVKHARHWNYRAGSHNMSTGRPPECIVPLYADTCYWQNGKHKTLVANDEERSDPFHSRERR